MSFPYALKKDRPLTSEDFNRYSDAFRSLLFSRLACQEVIFASELPPRGGKPGQQALKKKAFEVYHCRKPRFVNLEGAVHLLLPLGEEQVQDVAMFLSLTEEAVEEHGGRLTPLAGMATEALRLRAVELTDPLTGLPGRDHFETRLTQAMEEEGALLLLLEVYPQAREGGKGVMQVKRAATYLQSLFGTGPDLAAVGFGLFGLIWHQIDPGEARRMADILLRRLKREGFPRAHLGMVVVDPGMEPGVALDRAWDALGLARKRGPFGLSINGASEVGIMPLSPGDRKKLSRFWRGKQKFALVLARQDQPAVSNHFTRRVRQVLGPDFPVVFPSQEEAYIFLDSADGKAAKRFAEQFRAGMRKHPGASFSMGIACYPCLGFRKGDTPLNCQKALLHARFYGPDSMAELDGVTLNISGDAYYNEGDIRGAVKEYRRGLTLAPESVNLLNSLGVAFTQLNRSREAERCFAKALEVEPENFMALFNLGFLLYGQGREEEALGYLERALAVNGYHFDLLLQLGRIYCAGGRDREAVELLHRALEDPATQERRNGDLAAAHRLLGQALSACGKAKEAVTELEKALALNPRDGAAMGLLGELYLLAGESPELALSLCLQAVDIAGERSESWLRLGSVLARTGKDREAVRAFQEALRRERTNVQALGGLGEAWLRLQKPAMARRALERLHRLAPGFPLSREARKLMQGSG